MTKSFWDALVGREQTQCYVLLVSSPIEPIVAEIQYAPFCFSTTATNSYTQ